MLESDSQGTKKCPFCAEAIQAEALKCRYCQSMLVDANGHPVNVLASASGSPSGPGSNPAPGTAPAESPPSIVGLLLWNLACPGLGVWKLKHHWRGAIILGLTILAMTLWAQEAMGVITETMNKALRSPHAKFNLQGLEKAQSGFWYETFFWLYVYSFFDVIYVYYYLPKRT